MKVIGLTGNMGCGKSTVAAMLRELGAAHIDADAVVREIRQNDGEARAAIERRFGTLDPRRLGEIVFGNPDALRDLEAILHPPFRDAVRSRLAELSEAGVPATVVEVIKLLESPLHDACDAIWVVVCDEAEALARVMADRGLDEAEAQARLANGQVLFAVNDLFIGPRSHTSLRYSIRHATREERQSSSGIIISTGLGSTGWLKSILAGAEGIARSWKRTDGKPPPDVGFDWEAEYLYFSVREPFPSKTSGAKIVFGKITPNAPLEIVSHTPDTGVIFSDGIENDFLHFPSGMEAVITVSQRAGRLVI